MDGIDGSATSEAIHISLGALLLSFIVPEIPTQIIILSLVTLASCLGFIKFNWHPAKIFLGDVGSISLGLICGWILISLALQGLYAAAIILPLFYLADSGLTILKRLLKGKKIWEAHSEHFFQKAIRKGKSHNVVTKKIIRCNFLLLILSLASLYYPITSVITSGVVVIRLLYSLQKKSVKI